LAKPSPWGTFTSYSLPACLAHTALGHERRFRDVRDESGLPPTPERLRRRSEPTLRAKRVNHCTAAIFAPARRGRDMRFFARPAHARIFRAATGVAPVPYRDRSPGQPTACFRRSERRPTRYPLAIGMASGSIAIYTKYVFTPPGRHPSGHISGQAVQPSELRKWSCCLTTREDHTEGEVGEVTR
jgi:hypothetical protein